MAGAKNSKESALDVRVDKLINILRDANKTEDRVSRIGISNGRTMLCPLCNVEWRCTPVVIAKAGGPFRYIDAFNRHLMKHLKADLVLGNVAEALVGMRYFAPMVWDNLVKSETE